MFNWIKNKWNNNSFKQYFSLNFSLFWWNKKLDDSVLKKIDNDINNLKLDIARDTLASLKDDFDILTKKQKSNYYLYISRIEEFTKIFKEYPINEEDKTEYEYLIKTYDYYESNNTLLNKCIWLYQLWDKTEAEKIMANLYNKDKYEKYIYWFYLVIKKDNYQVFDEFIKTLDIKYSNDLYVKGILWNICKNMWWTHIEAFEKYYKQDYKLIKKFYEKITYFRIWSQYLNEKYWLINLSKEAKQEYIELEKFIDTFVNDLEWKNLIVEFEIYNIKAVINSQIRWLSKEADYYFKKILEKKDSWIVRINKILNIINSDWNNNEDIFLELEDIISKLNYYLELEKWNPNKTILYQAHTLLAQEYFLESKRRKQEWNISDNYKNKWLKLLKEFKDNYYDKSWIFYKRNFWILDIQSEYEKSKQKVIQYLKEDNCIIYNLLAYNIFEDSKYLNEAFRLYKDWIDTNYESIIQLADIFLLRLNDEKKFFDIIDSELRDLSNIKYFRNYITSWINLNELDKINKKLEDYKLENGIDYDYIKLNAYFEERKWNKEKAIEILDSFNEIDKYIDLLFWKSNFQYNLWKLEYKDTLNKICKIWEENKFSNFTLEDKLNFISSYWLVDLEKSIKICYDFLQEDIEEKYLLELKKVYFKISTSTEQKWFKFNQDEINNESVVVIKDLFNNNEQTIILDWYSNKNYWFDKVLKESDESYRKVIWKKKWDDIINLFWAKFGIEQKHIILWFEHKYNHFQRLIFSKYSDEVLWAIKIEIPTIEWKSDFSNFFNIMNHLWKQEKEKKMYIDDNFTKKWLLTFKVLNHFYWKSYLDIYYQSDFQILISDQLFKIDIWEKIENIILDPSSIISIFEFWLETILKDNFNIFISQSTFESFNNDLNDLQNNFKSNLSLASDWDWNHSKIDIPDEYYSNRETKLTNIMNYLKDNCNISTSDLILTDKDWFSDIFGKEFYYSLLIARDKGYYLFSDDKVIRDFARNKENNIKAFWIESFLIYLNSKKLIYPEFLLNSYINLINLNFMWILVHTWMIHYLLLKEDIKNLNLVIDYVKNKYNDINFIVSSLIYIIQEIENYNWNDKNRIYEYTEEAKKYYFDILYNIILKYFDKKEVDDMFCEFINKAKNNEDKQLFLKYIN